MYYFHSTVYALVYENPYTDAHVICTAVARPVLLRNAFTDHFLENSGSRRSALFPFIAITDQMCFNIIVRSYIFVPICNVVMCIDLFELLCFSL